MRTLIAVLAMVASVIAGAVTWYKPSFPDYVHRYRLTIAV
jgi:hypothetical protein